MTDLPQGWEWTTLGEACEIVSGSTPKTGEPSYWGESIPWITPDDLAKHPSQVTFRGRRSLTEAGYASCSTSLVPAGSVLYSSRAPIGYVTIAGQPACTNQGFKNLVPPRGLESRFLYWYLIHQTPEIRRRASGTTFKEVSAREFGRTPLPVPPQPEQRRIVAALEDHLSRLDAAGVNLKRSQKRLPNLRISALRKFLKGVDVPANLSMGTTNDILETARGTMRVTAQEPPWPIPRSWTWSSIGELFRVFVGTTPERSIASNWTGPIPWVSSGEVAFCRIAQTRESISEEALGNRATRLHPPGTVLLAMIGEGKTRGQAAILDIGAAHNQNCASIRVSETRMLPEYVYAVLEERYQETRRLSSGGNQLALNGARVREIPMPVPPLATQHYIVEQVAELALMEDRLSFDLHRSTARVAHFRRSLLADAFAGRLVPQDPTDEPASLLLERIRADRAAQPKVRRGRRGKNANQETLL